MLRFSFVKRFELLEIKNFIEDIIEDIHYLKKYDYNSDLHDEEIEEITNYKNKLKIL